VGIRNRCGHQYVGLVAGITEHHALITGALFFLRGPIDALSDVGRLLAERIQHGAGCAIESHRRIVVADFQHGFSGNFFDVDPGRRGYLAGDDDHAGLDECLARHSGGLVLFDDGIEHGIGYLV